ncbi:hypothetical protein [Paracoccus sediminilitoris]|uniref:hypothetical protein n=1 Tax=Paracoccus sediminilitoris TaxID=2202419 RepID=UPI000DB994B4|nr:hypothetical protein [Paracoccus sediminilitoris]
MDDAKGRPIGYFVIVGRFGDDSGAVVLPDSLAEAGCRLSGGVDADRTKESSRDKATRDYIAGRKFRRKAVERGRSSHKGRNRIEIMIGRLKGWLIIGKQIPQTVSRSLSCAATRHDLCPETFLLAITLAATGQFWPEV